MNKFDITESKAVCSLCKKNWGNSAIRGGVLMAGRIICPDCLSSYPIRDSVEMNSHKIQSRCPEGVEFRKWVAFMYGQTESAIVAQLIASGKIPYDLPVHFDWGDE